MWFLYALISALFASIRRTNEKRLSHKLHHFTIGWTIQLAALPVLGIGLLLGGPIFNPFRLGLAFWIPTLIVCIGFYPLNTFLYIQAFKHGELSKILPLSCLGPAFSLVLGWLFLDQPPSFVAVLAIVVMMAGIYVLNVKGKYLHNPLKMFAADKANLYTLCGLLLVTATGVLDKRAIDASGALFYSFVCTLGAAASLYTAAKLCHVKEAPSIRQHRKTLLLAGSLFGLSFGAYIFALSSGPLAYVTALRNSSTLLIGSVMGLYMLKETITKPKVVALVLILSGSALLALG